MKNNKRKLSLTKEKDFERSTKSLPQDFEKHLQRLEDPNYEGRLTLFCLETLLL